MAGGCRLKGEGMHCPRSRWTVVKVTDLCGGGIQVHIIPARGNRRWRLSQVVIIRDSICSANYKIGNRLRKVEFVGRAVCLEVIGPIFGRALGCCCPNLDNAVGRRAPEYIADRPAIVKCPGFETGVLENLHARVGSTRDDGNAARRSGGDLAQESQEREQSS
jgi:hypothetical protein